MSMIILEAHANDLLFIGDEEEDGAPATSVNLPFCTDPFLHFFSPLKILSCEP